MIPRQIASQLKEGIRFFPAITLTGPRQSGKTTLIKSLFPDFRYISLEDLEHRTFAQNDPRHFLNSYPAPLIIDEAQYAPDIFSYLQTKIDENRRPGMYILTGSQHFLLLEKITQSLAGRVGVFALLPFSYPEIEVVHKGQNSLEEQVVRGMYPDLYNLDTPSPLFYSSYLQTYLERDVRQLVQVADLSQFRAFMKLCAGMAGQQFNMSAIAIDLGVSVPTVKRWVSVLESSFTVFLQQPYFRNLNKRLVKTPRLFFFDTGLVCHLLGISNADQLNQYFQKGALIENWFMAELVKWRYHQGLRPECWYWRDKTGHEIDCIFEEDAKLKLIEIKSSKTIQPAFFKNIQYFKTLATQSNIQPFLLYGGDEVQQRSEGHVLGWRHFSKI